MTDKPDPKTAAVGGGVLASIGIAIAKYVVPKLVELLWPKLETYLNERLLPQLAAMVPLAAASAVNAVVEHIPGVEAVKDLGGLVEKVTGDVNVALPDIDIPGISDKFDLTEFINHTLGLGPK